jgi:hypothetical protein
VKMRPLIVALSLALGTVAAAHAEVNVSINLPGPSIGITLFSYPDLVRVPGTPVYYAPGLTSNFFFYDGLFWVFRSDMWFSSSWYNGPWQTVEPDWIPLYVLRVPVRYYRQPPGYFRGWRDDAPPRWGQHWGHDWERQRAGWDVWDRRSVPAPAPLPVYQRQYRGDNYPRAVEQQHSIRAENYRYQPRERVTQEQFQHQGSHDRRPDTQREAPDRREFPSRNPSSMQQRQAPQAEPDRPQRNAGEQPRAQHPAAQPDYRGPEGRNDRDLRAREERVRDEDRPRELKIRDDNGRIEQAREMKGREDKGHNDREREDKGRRNDGEERRGGR